MAQVTAPRNTRAPVAVVRVRGPVVVPVESAHQLPAPVSVSASSSEVIRNSSPATISTSIPPQSAQVQLAQMAEQGCWFEALMQVPAARAADSQRAAAVVTVDSLTGQAPLVAHPLWPRVPSRPGKLQAP